MKKEPDPTMLKEAMARAASLQAAKQKADEYVQKERDAEMARVKAMVDGWKEREP